MLAGDAAAELDAGLQRRGASGDDTIQGDGGNDVIYGFGAEDTAGDVGAISATLVASGLSRPVFAGSPPGDPDRLFILEQHTGQIKILDLDTGQAEALATANAQAAERGGRIPAPIHSLRN